ncbi:MAG: TIM-barrel domain-containing protein [Gaiellaceae bacterium]
MIRHHPPGRGHAYLTEPDQRVPLRPLEGVSFEVRATAAASIGDVRVELEDGRMLDATLRGDAVPEVDAVWGVTAPRVGEGHLTDAVSRLGEQPGRSSWAVQLEGVRQRYRFLAGGQATDWFDVAPAKWRRGSGALRVDGRTDRLVADDVAWLSDGELTYRLRFALRLQPGERVVGFGERFDALDQRGRRVDTAVFDQYKGQGARSYMPMPFAMVVGGGLGFHVDTGRRCWFDVAATNPDLLHVEVDLEPGELDPEIVLRIFDGDPQDVLRAFAAMPAEAPPDWIYGLWMSGNEWNSQARVLEEVERSAREGIEAGVIVIEAWSDEETFVAFNDAEYEPHPDGSPHRLADFTFPADGRWPDPKGMVDDLHASGIKVLLWQIPLVEAATGQAHHDRETMIDRDYCVRLRDGSPYRNRGWWFPDALMPDFTNPEAADWWLAKRRYLVEEVGVDGFKTDGGEHAWGSDLVYADGTHGGETNNRYPVLYAQAYHRLAPVTFSRAGFTGSGAVPCHWAGDEDSTWEAFRASITAGLSAGACGVFFWGWDLGGFSGEVPTAELYLRSAAAAALSPIMQYHSEFNHHRSPSRDRTPWNVAERTGASDAISVFRRFTELRERLVPYLVAEGRRAVADRRPLMRALFFDVPDDDRVWEFPYQYMLGDGLLVAPVCEEGARSWSTYLPAGEWVDAWTGEELCGRTVVERTAPLDEIPLFITAARASELAPLVRPTELAEVS